jgi:hypothetical protein
MEGKRALDEGAKKEAKAAVEGKSSVNQPLLDALGAYRDWCFSMQPTE